MPGYRLGVDLGTTYTSAAVGAGAHVESVGLGDAAPQVPSAVFLREDGALLFGEAAVQRGVTEPGRLAREFKRQIGDTTPLLLGGTPMSAHLLTGHLLRHVVDLVRDRQGASPERIVLAHPANWGSFRLELLGQAAQVAGVGTAGLLPEPAAAAAHFASLARLDVGEVAGVYDLGGGTFDAAVVRRTADGFEVLGEPQGLEQLGGVDFDAAVLAHVVRAADLDADSFDPDDPVVLLALDRLRRECTNAKIALSSDSDVLVPVVVPGTRTGVRVTRGEFEEAVRPALLDTVAAFGRALASAGVTSGQLAAVVLVGGSARIPLVKELLTAELRRPVVLSPQPKQSVALGAALLGAATPVPRRPDQSRTAGSSPGTPATTPGRRSPPRATAPGRAPRAGPPRTGSGSRRVLALSCAGTALLAVLVAVVGPTTAAPGPDAPGVQVAGQPLTGPVDVDVTSVPVTGLSPGRATLRTTLLGAQLALDQQISSAGQVTFSLSKIKLLAAGPLRAELIDGTGTRRLLLVPQHRPFLASVPGAICVLGVLFVAAYVESVLRGIRRRRRARVADAIALGALGTLCGLLLVVTAWGAVDHLLRPSTVVVVLLAGLAAGVLLSGAVDPRRM